ncbi:unnamed protein product [Nyctereutes procyonoides]|uniref:(raccoon dog) hypothetical protein n=1 Tax=Nyctereutes procyonoides TaxID=34880 RepID=A0A811Z3M6_NYCPR|nr:unnamed protein product [Nyctereutes procyonoides]
MSVSVLSLTRPLDTVSGLLQVASLLGLALLLLKAAQLYPRRQWLLKAVQQFPSAASHWLFGHKKELQKEDELQLLLKWIEDFPCAFARWIWGTEAEILIYDPDYMKLILGRSDPKSDGSYRLMIWFQHRRMLTPAFHYDILKPYMRLMADSVQVMLDKLEELHSQNSHLEIFEHASLMTLDTIMKCAFSYQDNHQADRLSDQAEKAHLQEEGKLEKIRNKRHLDFLDILLFAKMENGRGLSDKDLRAEVDTFMFEGHDTTASGISWILYALATHPEHQQTCREEIQSLLRDGASITWQLSLGSTWTRCPTPPCASRSSGSPLPSLMDAPCPKGRKGSCSGSTNGLGCVGQGRSVPIQ